MSRRSGQSGCIQKDGNWYVVRFWKDVMGREKRQRAWEKVCPISGPGKLSASERERKAKEIIAASRVDTEEYFNEVVRQVHGVTFREQAAIWLSQLRNRKRKPLAPSTLMNWQNNLDKWINPNLGDMALAAVNNLAIKNLVTVMCEVGLSPKSIGNYVQVVKMVVASAVNEQGEKLYPRKWNAEFIDMPMFNEQEQRRPVFTGDVVTAILAATKKEKYFMFFVLCASAGLRFGEALGIDIKNISPDCSTVAICQKAWRSQIHNFLKTKDGKREIDLHPEVAAMLQEFIRERRSGLLFPSRTGTPLEQSNILRRALHPILAKLGQPKCGAHAFRRFRNTYLKNRTSCPEGVRQFWLGWKDKDMSDLYDRIREDVAFRKEWAEKAGLGFELPPIPKGIRRSPFPREIVVIGRNGRKMTEKLDGGLAATV